MDIAAEVHKLEQDLIQLKAQQGGAGGSIFTPISDFTLKNTFVVSGSTNTGVVRFIYEVEKNPHPHTVVFIKSLTVDNTDWDWTSCTDWVSDSEGVSGMEIHEVKITGVSNGTHTFRMKGVFSADLVGGMLTFYGQDTNGNTILLETV